MSMARAVIAPTFQGLGAAGAVLGLLMLAGVGWTLLAVGLVLVAYGAAIEAGVL